ncbi:class I SAM-dependent methyltransferase [Ruegeria sp. R13_0]|uniref:class I SAM-dependent methyltransferase n=1 Tax=Ruegeria sp. R13_0 TaxID=2821099 RepID=UPI001ADA8132|nr:class I SAM-dependent methyltransferase [Ruegeria sp. R13_0]MBO9436315.1 class I SAM-dependent methyltransferase [Ruegeria sp. R13_0]
MGASINFAKEAEDPEITGLDLSSFDETDLMNIVLQRSEVMFDRPRPGRVIRAWSEGDDGPILAEVARLGLEAARRAAGVIRAEYRALSPVLKQLKPKRVADIGCGYAFFDLFLAREFNAELVLIDLETNDRRHFGFKKAGAAYSSLKTARDFLVSNGVSTESVTTVNPNATAPETISPVDLVVSFLSCGFHYPVDSYLPFLDRALMPGGAAIFDLRTKTADAQIDALARFGSITDLEAPPKARRILLQRSH